MSKGKQQQVIIPIKGGVYKKGDVFELNNGELVRKFESGATRSSDSGKPDFEGFLSPFVIERFGEYMSKHRILPDGSVRDSDNWQNGIPISQLVKSAFRHFMDVWAWNRGATTGRESVEDSLCGVFFNICAILHELLQRRNYMRD